MVVIHIGGLNAIQMDFLRELENIGAGNAATALANMLDRQIGLNVPNACFCDFSKMHEVLGGAEQLVTGSLVEMCGDLRGAILFVQTLNDSRKLSKALLYTMGVEESDEPEFPSEMQRSALMEIANILCGAYVNAIASLTDLYINCSVPGFAIDMAGAMMNLPAAMYGTFGDTVLLLETVFVDHDEYISGHFFLIPDIESHDLLMQKMGIA